MAVSNPLFAEMIKENKLEEEEDDDYHENRQRTVRSSVNADSDSD